MLKKIVRKILPRAILATLRNYRILSRDYGQFRAIKNWDCVDFAGKPIPWYTYPAIEYINQLDLSAKCVFEFGSGNSTEFWAARCKRLVSVEDNSDWFHKVKKKLPASVEYHFFENKNEYVQSISEYEDKFDVIIIDGSHRFECATAALKMLKDDGFIILDNSDWKDRTSKLLRDADLIEVDMSGFGPINDYTWTTSFYLKRNVNLSPAYDRQPVHGIGSLKHTED